MSDTINLRLLTNHTIRVDMGGIPLGNANSYKIIEGEENVSQFTVNKPLDYEDYDYYVMCINSQGYKCPLDSSEGTPIEGEEGELLIGDTFTLPLGMAVKGYGYITVYAKYDDKKVVWETLPIKIWQTFDDWENYVSKAISYKDTFNPDEAVVVNEIITDSETRKRLEDCQPINYYGTIYYFIYQNNDMWFYSSTNGETISILNIAKITYRIIASGQVEIGYISLAFVPNEANIVDNVIQDFDTKERLQRKLPIKVNAVTYYYTKTTNNVLFYSAADNTNHYFLEIQPENNTYTIINSGVYSITDFLQKITVGKNTTLSSFFALYGRSPIVATIVDEIMHTNYGTFLVAIDMFQTGPLYQTRFEIENLLTAERYATPYTSGIENLTFNDILISSQTYRDDYIRESDLTNTTTDVEYILGNN